MWMWMWIRSKETSERRGRRTRHERHGEIPKSYMGKYCRWHVYSKCVVHEREIETTQDIYTDPEWVLAIILRANIAHVT